MKRMSRTRSRRKGSPPPVMSQGELARLGGGQVAYIKVLSSEEETYRRLTQDLYDHGKVLRDDKFSWLYWSFTMFLVGMLVTAAAVVLDLTGIVRF